MRYLCRHCGLEVKELKGAFLWVHRVRYDENGSRTDLCLNDVWTKAEPVEYGVAVLRDER